MEHFLIAVGVGLLLAMAAPLYRAVAGPSSFDRLMGVNVIGTKTTVLLVIIGIIYGQAEMFVDIALAYALLNFIGTLAASRFFQHWNRGRARGSDAAGREGGLR